MNIKYKILGIFQYNKGLEQLRATKIVNDYDWSITGRMGMPLTPTDPTWFSLISGCSGVRLGAKFIWPEGVEPQAGTTFGKSGKKPPEGFRAVLESRDRGFRVHLSKDGELRAQDWTGFNFDCRAIALEITAEFVISPRVLSSYVYRDIEAAQLRAAHLEAVRDGGKPRDTLHDKVEARLAWAQKWEKDVGEPPSTWEQAEWERRYNVEHGLA